MTETLERPTTLATRQNGNGQSALSSMAQKYQVTEAGLADVIKKTCIKGNCSDAEFKAFIVVANIYGLNPMTKEIHAFASGGSIVPIVGIDGWTKLVNGQKDFDGCDFEEVRQDGDVGMVCTMHVKGRSHPIRITEWLKECKKNSPPWNTMPRRMLRHRAFIQAARLAFSLAGIYDEDEAKDIITNQGSLEQSAGASSLNAKMSVTSRPVSEGQRLEVEPSAMHEPEPVVIHGEEVVEPDGADAEPATEEPSGREAFLIQVDEARDAAAIPKGKAFDNAIKKWAVSKGVVGREHEATSADITTLLADITNRRGAFAGNG